MLEFHVIELPKIPEVLIENLKDDLLIWVKFINSNNREKMKKLTEKNEGIKAAYDELVSLENDDERRQIYRIREKAIMDYKVQNRTAREEGIKEGIKKGIEKGREEGIEKGKLQTAKNMLNNGLSVELISRVTELSIEKINELQKEIAENVN